MSFSKNVLTNSEKSVHPAHITAMYSCFFWKCS